MNLSILHPEVQDYIKSNSNTDIAKLLFKKSLFDTISIQELVEQIEARRKCKDKLPTWYDAQHIYYPNKLNIEQTSSEITAQYKSELIKGKSLIDITGGFGVDAYYFSKQFEHVTHCEIDSHLSQLVTHNFKQFKANNITTIHTNGLEYLSSTNKNYDWIYIDPSRRHDTKGKVFFLKDCLPNVPENLGLLFSRSKNMMIKTSPLLDISSGLSALEHVKEIHVIALQNDVKELIWILEKGHNEAIKINTLNIVRQNNQKFDFQLGEDDNISINYSDPLSYLYEPNSAILKSGGFKTIATRYNLKKLDQHSHLYTSQNLVDFPGRQFRIEEVITYNKSNLKRLNIKKANITTRNFLESVQTIRKKYKIADGGETYMFFTTINQNRKIVIICSKEN